MNKHSNCGFTLIEVLIATTILATMTVLISQTLQHSLMTKGKIEKKMDQFALVRDTMRVIKSDFNLAFHFRDYNKEILERIEKKTSPAQAPPANQRLSRFKTNNDQNEETSQTHFIGSNDRVNFVTLNNYPVFQDEYVSDYMEVGYFTKSCQSRAEPDKTTTCLFRRTSAWVDKDVEEGGKSTMLLDKIEEFSLRYYGRGKQDWVKDWKTKEGGDDATTGRFPEAVEITLSMAKTYEKESAKISIQIVAPIRFPNNPEVENKETSFAN